MRSWDARVSAGLAKEERGSEVNKRPFVGNIVESRKRALTAMNMGNAPTWYDIDILVRATAPMLAFEVEELADQLGVSRGAVEMTARSILGDP